MNVPHGARQQHSTSVPAAGPFSRDFNESFMIIRPLAPRRPAAGGEVLPPAPRAALFPLPPPRALPPAPRYSPCRRRSRPRRAPRAALPPGEEVSRSAPRRAILPAALVPPAPRFSPSRAPRAAARAAAENELASASSIWYNDSTVHRRDAGRQWGEHLRQHGGTRRGRLRRRGDARCAPRHSAAAARLPARNRAGVCDRKNQRGKPTCAL